MFFTIFCMHAKWDNPIFFFFGRKKADRKFKLSFLYFRAFPNCIISDVLRLLLILKMSVSPPHRYFSIGKIFFHWQDIFFIGKISFSLERHFFSISKIFFIRKIFFHWKDTFFNQQDFFSIDKKFFSLSRYFSIGKTAKPLKVQMHNTICCKSFSAILKYSSFLKLQKLGGCNSTMQCPPRVLNTVKGDVFNFYSCL